MIVTIIYILAILTILVLVHELGHFVTARKFGIAVEEFGIGFPPRAIGLKRGKTIFSLNWIPFGGFVKIKGEQGENMGDEDSFASKPAWQRGIVLSSGVLMNFLLACVLLIAGFVIGAPYILNGDELPLNGKLRNEQIIIASVIPETPAETAELTPGDSISEIDGKTFYSIENIQKYIGEKTGREVTLTLLRNDETITKKITPQTNKEAGDRAIIGVELMRTGIISYNFFEAVPLGIIKTFDLTKAIIFAFGSAIWDLLSGRSVSVDISGPVGIAFITNEVTKLGLIYIIQFAALLTLNLAIINFLPIPALDGGRFLFLMIEKIRGSAINQRVENVSHTIGFAILMLLIIFVMFRDIQRYQHYFESAWNRFTNLL